MAISKFVDVPELSGDKSMSESESKPKEITMVGLRKGSSLMMIAIISFVAMSMVMATSILEGFSNLILVMVAGALSLTLIGAVFMITRYFAEQQILYSATNYYLANNKE
jgi:hypothetical protein